MRACVCARVCVCVYTLLGMPQLVPPSAHRPQHHPLLFTRAEEKDDLAGGRMDFDEFLAVFGRCRIKDSEITMDYAVSVAVSTRSPHKTGATLVGDGHTALRSFATVV